MRAVKVRQRDGYGAAGGRGEKIGHTPENTNTRKIYGERERERERESVCGRESNGKRMKEREKERDCYLEAVIFSNRGFSSFSLNP